MSKPPFWRWLDRLPDAKLRAAGDQRSRDRFFHVICQAVVPDSLDRHILAVNLQRRHLPAEGLVIDVLERDLVRQALERSGGNQSRAAQLLGMTRDQIRYRLEKYGNAP